MRPPLAGRSTWRVAVEGRGRTSKSRFCESVTRPRRTRPPLPTPPQRCSRRKHRTSPMSHTHNLRFTSALDGQLLERLPRQEMPEGRRLRAAGGVLSGALHTLGYVRAIMPSEHSVPKPSLTSLTQTHVRTVRLAVLDGCVPRQSWPPLRSHRRHWKLDHSSAVQHVQKVRPTPLRSHGLLRHGALALSDNGQLPPATAGVHVRALCRLRPLLLFGALHRGLRDTGQCCHGRRPLHLDALRRRRRC